MVTMNSTTIQQPVRKTTIDLPVDVFEWLLHQRRVTGVTMTFHIVAALRAYIKARRK